MSDENKIPYCRYDEECMRDATFITSDTLCPMCDGCKAIFYKLYDMLGAPTEKEMYNALKICEASL